MEPFTPYVLEFVIGRVGMGFGLTEADPQRGYEIAEPGQKLNRACLAVA